MSDRRWFRPAHIQQRSLHAFGVWLGWWFIGIQVGKGWATDQDNEDAEVAPQ